MDSGALIKKYLTPALYEILAPLKTKTGFTLDAAIQSGLKNPDSSIGIYAGDCQSYFIFSSILDPIIHAYHAVGEDFKHGPDLTGNKLDLVDPDNEFILSTRIRVARNLKDICFPCHISARDRRRVEFLVSDAVKNMPQNLKGQYIPFQDMPPSQMENLLTKKLAFPKGDRFQDTAGINRDFPNSRGIFLSRDKKFMIWVNEEDHLRIISLESSCDICGVFNRLCLGLNHLGKKLEFAFDKKYGFLTSCPTNIGTAMRASVHIRLKKLEKNQSLLRSIANQYHLQIRGTGGEKTSVDKGIFDISNKRRLGISGTRIIQNLHAGIAAIIQAEKTCNSTSL
ncbi:MAG: arginine kinase [Desulfobacteraceae bacterium]|nr:arginine kinase [Desulfobacteraceae bacterium]